MASELIIGACHGLASTEVESWVASARACGFSGDVVLVSVDTPRPVRRLCAAHHVTLVEVPSSEPFDGAPGETRIHHQRYLLLHRFLSRHDGYELVLTTDVRDVVFQQDPFPRLRALLEREGAEIAVGSECIRMRDEPWNRHMLRSLYPFAEASLADAEVLCSGVIGGHCDALRDLLMLVYLASRALRSDEPTDQTALNVLSRLQPLSDTIAVVGLSEVWVCHLAVAGPTPLFREWGFDRSLLDGPPRLDGDLVVTPTGATFDIVHQYTRIAEWDRAISRRYRESPA